MRHANPNTNLNPNCLSETGLPHVEAPARVGGGDFPTWVTCIHGHKPTNIPHEATAGACASASVWRRLQGLPVVASPSSSVPVWRRLQGLPVLARLPALRGGFLRSGQWHTSTAVTPPRGTLACVTVSTAVTPRVGHLHAARCVSLSTVGVSFSLGAQGPPVRVPLRSDGSGSPPRGATAVQ